MNHVGTGVVLVFVGHILFGILVVLVGTLATNAGIDEGGFGFLFAMMIPGLTQLLWVVPLAIWAGVKGYRSTLVGLLVSAGIVFLLNGACWGMLAMA